MSEFQTNKIGTVLTQPEMHKKQESLYVEIWGILRETLSLDCVGNTLRTAKFGIFRDGSGVEVFTEKGKHYVFEYQRRLRLTETS